MNVLRKVDGTIVNFENGYPRRLHVIEEARSSVSASWVFECRLHRPYDQPTPMSFKLTYAEIVAARQEARLLKKIGDFQLKYRHGLKGFWLFRDEFFVTSQELEPVEATALLLEAENKIKARIMRARALMEQVEAVESRGRAPIPDDVKVAVWNRDGGKCVRCGSNENIEFDHIIPFSKGGSSTFRNLQILCEPCNRAKGPSIIG